MARRTRVPRITAKSKRTADVYDFFADTYIRHTDREWYDKPFTLDRFQYDDIWKPIFGTLGRDGTRWYRRALIGLPRYTGKSEIAGRIVITVMMMEPCPEGEYGIIASSKEQARIVFNKVSSMIRLDAELSAKFDVMRSSVVMKETGATLKVYPAEEAAVQGVHFVCCVADEVHVWKGTALYSAIVSGMKDKNSLLVLITTASEHRSGVLWDYIIPNMMDDEKAYICWKGGQSLEDQLADKPFDPADRRLWRRACFASWHTMQQMEDLFAAMPLSKFIRYILNIFPPDDLSQDRAFRPFKVKRCLTGEPFNWEARSLCLGIDGANSGDSFALVFTYAQDGVMHCYPMIIDERTSLDGRFYDLTQVETTICEYWRDYRVDRVAIDPARLLLLAQHLTDRFGIPIETYAQDGKNMGAASQFLLSLIEDGRLRIHGKDAEKLKRHLLNSIREDARAYGWRIGKSSREKKIDGAIALSISAITCDSMAARPSFGILTL